ncbi:hypothetical protein [Streptomyces syringium]|uniref:Uncharacterized protein n=1 Tax=Streptomyces syringium TaxID=76729 RepID=A0ABS4XX78_9ACTN|nr:hypothetical protein [Streptomyces syringium]MBP2401125.1 hypothetical protein [Streptomyces syringium]
MTKNPQQNALRRSGKGATSQDSAASKAGLDKKVGPGGPASRARGTDKGTKGGGQGGGTPPEQHPDHP